MKKIYTLGTDRRGEEDFIEILLAYYIQLVIDVRRFPTSKFQTFIKGNLENLLRKEGIEYHFLGTELGGFRKGGYTSYIITDNFSGGLICSKTLQLLNLLLLSVRRDYRGNVTGNGFRGNCIKEDGK